MLKKTCPICGKEFLCKKKTRITCSRSCGGKHNIRKNGSPFSKQEIQGKAKKTRLEKYGNDYYSNWEKAKRTNLKRYGSECTFGNKEIQRKATDTKLLLYGEDYFSNIAKNIDHSKIDYKSLQNKRKKSISKSPKLSKIEQRVYNKLIEKFPDIISQYYNKEKYPFLCDFYIPSLDLYIEFNGDAFHNKHPFDNTNEKDLQKLEDLKEKSKEKPLYKSIIKVWTEIDPYKREIARQNSLNYIEFWKEKDVYKWIENYKIKEDLK